MSAMMIDRQMKYIGGGSLASLAITPFTPEPFSIFVVVLSSAVLVGCALIDLVFEHVFKTSRRQSSIGAMAGAAGNILSGSEILAGAFNGDDEELVTIPGRKRRGLFNDLTETFYDLDEEATFTATKREIRHVRDMLNIRHGATDRAVLEKKLRAFMRMNAQARVPHGDHEGARRRIRIAKMLVRDILEGMPAALVLSAHAQGPAAVTA